MNHLRKKTTKYMSTYWSMGLIRRFSNLPWAFFLIKALVWEMAFRSVLFYLFSKSLILFIRVYLFPPVSTRVRLFPLVFTCVQSCLIRVTSCSTRVHLCSFAFDSCSRVFNRVNFCSFLLTRVPTCVVF